MKYSSKEIVDILKCDLSFCLLDSLSIEEDKIFAEKRFSIQEWFFKMHFPGNPLVPGALLFESIVQALEVFFFDCNNIEYKFSECKKLRMFNSVRPGDSIQIIIDKGCLVETGIQFHADIYISRHGEEKRLLACQSDIAFKKNNFEKKTFSCNDFDPKDYEKIDYSNMDKYTGIPIDYCFADIVFLNDECARGIKHVSCLDWYVNFYKGIDMPICFMLETIMQTGVYCSTKKTAMSDKLLLFNSFENLKFYKFFSLSDEINTYVSIISSRRGIYKLHGMCCVNNEVGCEMDFTIIAPEKMINIE